MKVLFIISWGVKFLKCEQAHLLSSVEFRPAWTKLIIVIIVIAVASPKYPALCAPCVHTNDNSDDDGDTIWTAPHLPHIVVCFCTFANTETPRFSPVAKRADTKHIQSYTSANRLALTRAQVYERWASAAGSWRCRNTETNSGQFTRMFSRDKLIPANGSHTLKTYHQIIPFSYQIFGDLIEVLRNTIWYLFFFLLISSWTTRNQVRARKRKFRKNHNNFVDDQQSTKKWMRWCRKTGRQSAGNWINHRFEQQRRAFKVSKIMWSMCQSALSFICISFIFRSRVWE